MNGYKKYKCLHPEYSEELIIIIKKIGKIKSNKKNKSNISFCPRHKSLNFLFSFILTNLK